MAAHLIIRGTAKQIRYPNRRKRQSILPPPRRLKDRVIEYENTPGRAWWWKQ